MRLKYTPRKCADIHNIPIFSSLRNSERNNNRQAENLTHKTLYYNFNGMLHVDFHILTSILCVEYSFVCSRIHLMCSFFPCGKKMTFNRFWLHPKRTQRHMKKKNSWMLACVCVCDTYLSLSISIHVALLFSSFKWYGSGVLLATIHLVNIHKPYQAPGQFFRKRELSDELLHGLI